MHYRKGFCELKKQLTDMSQESNISRMQGLEIEKEKMVEMLEQQRIQQVQALEIQLLQAQTIARTKQKETSCDATSVNIQQMKERITEARGTGGESNARKLHPKGEAEKTSRYM